MKNLLFALLLLLLCSGISFSQNNSALTPQALPGLNLQVRGGTILLGTSSTGISTQTVALSNNATNYVFLTTVGAIQTNTSGFTGTVLQIATVVTAQGQIVSIQDNRPDFIFNGSGLPAGCTSPASAQLQCSIFISTSAVNNVGAAAQVLMLHGSGDCNGTTCNNTNEVGFIAPASVVAVLQWTLPTVDACGAYGSLVSDAAQHLSFNCGPARIITADWTCGTGGTVASCVAAQTIGTLTFTLPLLARSWTIDCEGVVGQATAATANSWNIQTATNGATNLTAWYDMYTAATVKAGGAVTDVASTTTTQVIAPTWTLGGVGTKMPFHIRATVEGASATGTVVNIQLVAPTVADLVTIYRGSQCSAY